MPDGCIKVQPDNGWKCVFEKGRVKVTVTVRIGVELWNYIAGHNTAFTELCVSLIRACVTPTDGDPEDYAFRIADLPEIISLSSVPRDFNVAILQRSQLEWLFFIARHFCDRLE